MPPYVIRWPGVGMIDPPITGPTGTYGGANVGTGPLPNTFITIWDEIHVMNAMAKAFANAPKRASENMNSPLRLVRIRFFNELAVTISDIVAETHAMSGVGIFGVGGAIGPGKAANVGYHGNPGTVTPFCQLEKASPTPWATAALTRASSPMKPATMGAVDIRGVRLGPFNLPPNALTAVIVTSEKNA
jgi:hypothetical protein